MITSMSKEAGHVEITGLSTDVKPTKTEGVVNGSIFLEMDTSKVYIYDAVNNYWREL